MFDDETRSNLLSYESCKLVLKGSFVIAAICREGIVLSSESRANIFDKTDKNQKPIAYYDDIQKIYPIGSAAMAETGQGLILNVFFSAIVDQFVQTTNSTLRADHLLPVFIRYCEQQLPSVAVTEIKKQKLFSAGYVNGHPTICYFNEDQPNGPFGCIQDAGFVESDATLLTRYTTELPVLSADKVAALSKEAIVSYAREGDRWKTIGGPINILLVTETESRWLEKTGQTRHWKYIQDLIKDYRDGNLELSLIPPATREQLEDLLDTVPQVQ